MATLKALALRVWFWWTTTPPPPLGAVSARWIRDYDYRSSSREA